MNAKFVITSDWHLDASTGGVERRGEIEQAVMDGPVRAANEENADYFIFLGDLCDPGGRSAVHDVAFPSTVVGALDSHRKSIWIVGNHDCVLDSRGYTTLDPLMKADSGMHRVVTRPSYFVDGFSSVVFLCLPWVPPTLRDCDAEGRVIAEAFAAGSHHGGRVVALGHRTIPGLIPGSEAGELARGADHLWPESVAPRAKLSFCGHHHHGGTYDFDEGKIHVPGSLVRLTFGDAGQERGFVVAEV